MAANKPYSVILADSPWPFATWSEKGAKNAPESHYPTMKIEDLKTLPVQALAADNAVLFMWGLWRNYEDVPAVMNAWGFRVATLAWVWIKANKGGFGHFVGQGYYTRQNSEFCLLGVRGSMPVSDRSILSIIYSPLRGHSEKPVDQYRKIEALYPAEAHPNRLELFARRRRPGWDAWGHEIESPDVDLPILPSYRFHKKEG